MRQKKREVKIGNVTIGGSNPIAVQTMLNVPVEDIEGNVAQAKRCEAAGCQILRVTCPSPADAKCIEAVKNAVNIPIVADIHFDYKAALACADVGVDKIRINPGNIGDDDRVKAVVDACQQKNIPIRIGVNGGSLEKHILARYGAPTPEAMVESALYHVRLLEKFDFNNIVISIKNSNVPRMMEAYRQLSAVTDYPLHVGVTEAGTYQMGLLKSGMGIGGMLLEGIGDTIRVSLAADPEKEVEAGFNILRAVGFPVTGPEVITCPTCGRTQYPCTEIANEVEKRLQGCCGEFKTFNKIVTPILKPAFAVQIIFTFVTNWNNYFMPRLILTSKSKYTIPLVLNAMRYAGPQEKDVGMFSLYIVLAILPVVIVYLCLSKFIIRGVALGSVKG